MKKQTGEEDLTMVIIIFRHLILIAQNSYSELSWSGLHHADAVGVRNGIGAHMSINDSSGGRKFNTNLQSSCLRNYCQLDNCLIFSLSPCGS